MYDLFLQGMYLCKCSQRSKDMKEFAIWNGGKPINPYLPYLQFTLTHFCQTSAMAVIFRLQNLTYLGSRVWTFYADCFSTNWLFFHALGEFYYF